MLLGVRNPIPDWARTSWPGWFAPDRMPFLVDDLAAEDRAQLPDVTTPEVPLELKDTFWIYGADRDREQIPADLAPSSCGVAATE